MNMQVGDKFSQHHQTRMVWTNAEVMASHGRVVTKQEKKLAGLPVNQLTSQLANPGRRHRAARRAPGQAFCFFSKDFTV
jgi:hypothetical protein